MLCTFALGVILMAVGTFITSHAYEDKNRDPVMLGVGPGLLGLGGKPCSGATDKSFSSLLIFFHQRESLIHISIS